MHFPEKDKIFSRLHTILPTNAKVVVAFSGGPDSSFLFALLKEFYKSQSRNQQNIILAHFHHGQRKESDKELAHLFKQHEQYDIYYNPKKPKKWQKETALRTLRKEFFEEILQTEKTPYLFTGHNLDDRIETSLLNLIRGTSQKGLGNMKFVDEAKNMTTVRPLLNMKKADILALCRKNEISYFTDASNFDDNYTARNKLRNTLIPQITSLLPQGAVKRYDSWRLIYEQWEVPYSSRNVTLIPRPTHPMRGATYCYELHINHPFSPADWAEVFSKIGITKGVSQKTLAEWTRFSNTSSDGYKLLGGVYFFSSHGTIYAIDGKKDFRKNSPKPLVNYAQEGDAYKGKRLKKRMINQKIPIFRRNFIRVERVKWAVTKILLNDILL